MSTRPLPAHLRDLPEEIRASIVAAAAIEASKAGPMPAATREALRVLLRRPTTNRKRAA